MSSGLPPIDPSLVPQGVRAQGTKAVGLYESALSFEGVLDQQLAQSLTETLKTTDANGEPTTDAATNLTLQLLPQALAKGLVQGGGLGLAPSLYEALGGKLSPPQADTVTPHAATGSAHGRTGR